MKNSLVFRLALKRTAVKCLGIEDLFYFLLMKLFAGEPHLFGRIVWRRKGPAKFFITAYLTQYSR